ncbi:PP2C family protein-serine/threonine phosphatase [Rubripirellula reticaptiva]|uniref:PPM-type phosphatase domain-containing protein n=1 Tax=Rubripirellula reticaptiva TaxID=2528013 RepID=A0A5C6EW77_9BACT|nr:protein phosphatase 2C domain-containing protein [Rubripirellula reticaptiva]TWU51926.1 putative protein phosphatase 2C-type [Rubripirellula reticaptiva]
MSERWNPGIVFAHLTDVGMRRANNQDSLACLPAKSPERFRDRGHLFVVADGMGAHAAGELASQMATERIAMQFFRSHSRTTADALRSAVSDANDEIHQRGQSNPEFHNMGTTASALVIAPTGAWVGHVGDSRVYRLRNGLLEQLTFDHSLVWEMEATGQSCQGIPSNVITRSLGPNAVVNVDLEGPFPVEVGDQFLLCSDGLTGLVEDNEIGVLLDCLPAEKAVRVLVDLANLRGGSDNTSVIVVRVTEPIEGSDVPRKPSRGREEPGVSRAILGTVVICILGAILLAVMAIVDPYDANTPGDRNWIGPMVVAIILGTITSVIALVQWMQVVKNRSPAVVASGAKGPYRRYDAKPTNKLYERLGETVQSLRDAANLNNWMMDWQKVDAHQTQGRQALEHKDVKDAIRAQSEAIIETMNQLREQNNRAADETAIDY